MEYLLNSTNAAVDTIRRIADAAIIDLQWLDALCSQWYPANPTGIVIDSSSVAPITTFNAVADCTAQVWLSLIRQKRELATKWVCHDLR